MLQFLVEEVDDGAADGGNGEEPQPQPGCNHADDQGDQAGPWGRRGQNHIRERHDSERHVRHVVKETAHEPVAYLPLDEHHGNDADQVGYKNSQQYVNQYPMLLHRNPS